MFERKPKNLHVARPDVEIERGKPHKCWGCYADKFCTCGEDVECYLCAKCRRISVDRNVSEQDGFSLLEGVLYDEMYGPKGAPGSPELNIFSV